MDSAKDLLTSTPVSSTLSSSTATDVSPHRSYVRCTRRMSSVKYDKHTLCLNCKEVQRSLDVRCDECRAWSSEVMLNYLKHRKSLVSKGKKKITTPSSSSSSCPSVPAATVAATVASPLPPLASDECIKDYVNSFLTNFLSQSASVGTANNPSVSAPPVVPDSAPPLLGV